MGLGSFVSAILVSSLRAALRARRRQYLLRGLLEDLRRSSQTKDAFLATVSHELRLLNSRSRTVVAASLRRSCPTCSILSVRAIAIRSAASGGLGLGLAIVKHLVELHGGSVTAQSVGLDHGATFRVKLPSAQQRSHPANLSFLEAASGPDDAVLAR